MKYYYYYYYYLKMLRVWIVPVCLQDQVIRAKFEIQLGLATVLCYRYFVIFIVMFIDE